MTLLNEEQIASRIAYDQHRRWNATYNRTDISLQDRGRTISEGLARRLAHYARRRVTDSGWGVALADCEVHVSGQSDVGDRPGDLSYQVEFTNSLGNTISVFGILIRRGWPCLNHGMSIE